MQKKVVSPIRSSQMTVGRLKNRLHFTKQFQELNKRIQSFEDKNESIINRIKDAYNFKKTAPHNLQVYIPTTEHDSEYRPENVQFIAEHPEVESEVYNLNRISSESQIKNSNQYEVGSEADELGDSMKQEYEMPDQVPLKNLNIRPSEPKGNIFTPPNHRKVEGDKLSGNHLRVMKQSTQEVESNYFNEENEPIVNLQYAKKSFLQGAENEMKISYLEEKVNRTVLENSDLLQYLKQKEQELHRYKNVEIKFRTYANSVKRVIEELFENFQEEYLLSKLTEVRKHVKKCENKIKKLGLRVSDVAQERRSRQVIQTSRTQRSHEQQRRRENRNKSITTSFVQEEKGKDSIPSRYSDGRSSRLKSLANQHQLQNIAVNYEQMIKNKTEENEKCEGLLRAERKRREQLQLLGKELGDAVLEKEKVIRQLRTAHEARHEDHETLEQEVKHLLVSLSASQEEVRQQFRKEKQMQEVISKMQKTKRQLQEEYQFKLQNSSAAHNSAAQQLNRRLSDCQSSKNEKSRELKQVREKLLQAEKRYMQKECEIFALSNKLKKVESECLIKEQKLSQLQALLLNNNDTDTDRREAWPDLTLSTHLRGLEQNIKSATDQIQEKNTAIYQLLNYKKEMEGICQGKDERLAKADEEIKSLKANILWLEGEIQRINSESIEKSMEREKVLKIELLEEELQRNRELIQNLYRDNTQIREEMQRGKQQNLVNSRELIRLSAECAYNRDQAANCEGKLERAREEKGEMRKRIRQLQQSIEQTARNNLSMMQKYINEAQELRQALQQAQFRKQSKQDSMVASFAKISAPANVEVRQRCKTDHSIAYKNIKDSVGVCEQYEYITMEDVSNDKNMTNQIMLVQSFVYKQQKHDNRSLSAESGANVYEEKIKAMEGELQKGKERERQLSEIMHQLFQNTKSMEDENKKLAEEIKEKQRIVLDYKTRVEQRQTVLQNVSSKNLYSSLQYRNSMKEMKDNERSPVRDTHLSFKLSIDYSEDNNADLELSRVSNISDIFKRDDLLERTLKNGKTSREEQVLLYSRTSAYIKSLKETIEAKQKRIKLLEKQISNIKSQENSHWSFKDKDRSSSEKANCSDDEVLLDDIDEIDEYKDYDSVQLDIRRSKYYEMVKQLQHDKNLMTEQNKMLVKQMEVLQNELQKAEEQQNSLMKIKELYKDQIKRMIETAESREHELAQIIKELQNNIQESESHHNLEALKQLFFKIIQICAYVCDPACKGAKKQQKRKELEEYIKVMCSLLRLQAGIRDRLIASLRK